VYITLNMSRILADVTARFFAGGFTMRGRAGGAGAADVGAVAANEGISDCDGVGGGGGGGVGGVGGTATAVSLMPSADNTSARLRLLAAAGGGGAGSLCGGPGVEVDAGMLAVEDEGEVDAVGMAAAAEEEDDEATGMAAAVWWRKLNLGAEVESSISRFGVKRLVPGGFNSGLTGSTCTALPRVRRGHCHLRGRRRMKRMRTSPTCHTSPCAHPISSRLSGTQDRSIARPCTVGTL
jgi:hypothetical protein